MRSLWRILSFQFIHFFSLLRNQKRVQGGQKNGEHFVWPFLSKGRLNHWARYSEPQKTDCKNIFFFSELQELENWAEFGHFGRLGLIWLLIRLHNLVIWLHKLIMYDSNTSTDVPENFVCMAIWGSVKGYSALSCQDLSFLVGRRSAVPLSVYPFIISFTFLFLHFFAGTPVCIGACRASRTFQVVVFCFFLVELQRWSPGRAPSPMKYIRRWNVNRWNIAAEIFWNIAAEKVVCFDVDHPQPRKFFLVKV